MIVRDKLPKFATRYFKANMETKSIQSLYGYALDLTSFFEYLKYREPDSFDVARMTLLDLNDLTPSVIEDYLDYSREYTDKGVTKTRSEAAIKRRYSSLSSFFNYYYKLDMIDRNPVSKVTPPRIKKQYQITPSVKANRRFMESPIPCLPIHLKNWKQTDLLKENSTMRCQSESNTISLKKQKASSPYFLISRNGVRTICEFFT